MKYKLSSLLVFLSLLICFMPVVFACDWTTYGNAYTPLWNEMLSPTTCYGQINTNLPTTLSIAQGMTAGSQPLVASIGGTPYLFFNNGNYLEVYGKSLILQQQSLVGVANLNLDALDWNNDGNYELANIYTYNATISTLKIYSYTPSTNSLTSIYQYNITGGVNAGLRHTGENIYFMNTTSLIKINSTNFVATKIGFSPTAFSEPLSFYNDYNGNGIKDFMTFSSSKIVVFEENGNVILELNTSIIRSARMINPTGTSLWKLAVLYETGFGINTAISLVVYNLDGSIFWNKLIESSGSSAVHYYGDMAITDDYDGDLLPDIYVFANYIYSVSADVKKYRIYKGIDGTLLFSKDRTLTILGYTSAKLTIADMNHDTKNDFISNLNGRLEIYNPYSNTSLFNSSVSSGYCIPADLNLDGNLDIICSNSGNTTAFMSNYTNQNAQIVSVTYDPSTSIAVNSNLNMIISATDVEGNMPLYYRHKCFASDNWSVEDTNPAQSCYYSSVGNFENSVGVRDFYHSTYSTFVQTIYVTSTGVVCGNGICETGETNANCPADCPSNVTQTQATEIGGMPLPTKIVDVNNIEQGLLPEVYYGILAFLSGTLSPMIILIFVIFFALIVLTIGVIIKKIAHKVGDLAH